MRAQRKQRVVYTDAVPPPTEPAVVEPIPYADAILPPSESAERVLPTENTIGEEPTFKMDVPVDVLEPGTDRAYCGSGGQLSKLGLELDGLQKSLEYVYENLCQRNV